MDSFTLSIVAIAVLAAILLGLISLSFRLVGTSRKRKGHEERSSP